MTRALLLCLAAALAALTVSGCNRSSRSSPLPPIVVNSLLDVEDPPQGTVTLRSALAAAASGQAIVFDPSLDGGTIALSVVGAEHTVLRGEVMGIRDEPSGPVSYLVGYFDRDYGRSALYKVGDVVIDASSLPAGITIAWTGDALNRARVLAVYGDLAMANVTVTGGYSEAEDISTGNPEDQPWTLGRGGGLAVWGLARLNGCTIHDNHCVGDFDSSRDRGAFGGGLYANLVEIEDCVISGNTVLGGGAGGGGVACVGGAGFTQKLTSRVLRTSLTGNRISGIFAYGAGIYSDGGGIGNSNTLELTNCTLARNLAEPPPGVPGFLLGIGYWRGGGAYISNGTMTIHSCTITENETHGVPRTDDLDKPNLAGAVAATIGNAHSVEDLKIGYSIIAGNTVTELGPGGATYEHDVFTGSLVYYRSLGHNRIGVLDFSQILVPVGEPGYLSLCRRHYPKEGDMDGVAAADVLDLSGGVTHSGSIVSRGVDDKGAAVLYYRPAGDALDAVPMTTSLIPETYMEYDINYGNDNFPQILLARLEAHYGLTGFAADFTSAFEAYLMSVDTDEDEPGVQPHLDPRGNPIYTLADTHWFGPKETWPKELVNYAYIEFWHRLDAALRAEGIPGMGPEGLGDEEWKALFSPGPLAENPAIVMREITTGRTATPTATDQQGTPRAAGGQADIGAIEVP